MAMPEQFSLRWNDFHSNLSQSFHALLECEDLVDVTLAAGGQYVHAHKLILSVCSPYFKELFKSRSASERDVWRSLEEAIPPPPQRRISLGLLCAKPKCVSHNPNDIKKGIYFFRFPEDPLLRQRWCEAVDISVGSVTLHTVVCSKHFNAKDIIQTADSAEARKGTNPCEHPIVILKDVAHQELRQLLQFMYRGEVHVRQQELSGFLHTAEMLQVKGLTGGRERSESPPPPPTPVASVLKEETPPRPTSRQDEAPEWVPGGEDTIATESPPESDPSVKEEARSPLKRLLKNTPNKNSFNVKKKARPANDSPTHPENTEYGYDSEPLIDFDNDLYHSVLVLPESAKESGWNCKTGGVKCPSCHRFFANRYNLKVHIRDKHDTREGTLQCEICQKRMRNPSCLRVHMYHHRKQAAYLAQLSTQGDQLSHVVQNMVGTKWRAESSLGSSDYDNFPSAVQAPADCAKLPGAEPSFPAASEALTPPQGDADVEKP